MGKKQVERFMLWAQRPLYYTLIHPENTCYRRSAKHDVDRITLLLLFILFAYDSFAGLTWNYSMATGIYRLNWVGWAKMASLPHQVVGVVCQLGHSSHIFKSPSSPGVRGFQEDKNKSSRTQKHHNVI